MLSPDTPRTVHFHRHSIKDGHNAKFLGPAGYALSRLFGAERLRGRGFTAFCVSDIWRTHQTLAGLDEGAGDFRYAHATGPTLAPFNGVNKLPQAVRLWEGPCRIAEDDGGDMLRACLMHDDSSTRYIAHLLGRAVSDWMLKELPPGARALVIGHSPMLEMIAFDLFGEKIAPLDFLDGFRIAASRDRQELQTTKTHPDLDAAPLRARVREALASSPSA